MDPGGRTILSAVLSGVRPGTVPRFLQKLFSGRNGGICPDCISLCRNRQTPWNRLSQAWPVSPYFPYLHLHTSNRTGRFEPAVFWQEQNAETRTWKPYIFRCCNNGPELPEYSVPVCAPHLLHGQIPDTDNYNSHEVESCCFHTSSFPSVKGRYPEDG